MDDFVANQNVARFRRQLEGGGVDQKTRATVLGLVLREEDMLGRTQAALAERFDELECRTLH